MRYIRTPLKRPPATNRNLKPNASEKNSLPSHHNRNSTLRINTKLLNNNTTIVSKPQKPICHYSDKPRKVEDDNQIATNVQTSPSHSEDLSQIANNHVPEQLPFKEAMHQGQIHFLEWFTNTLPVFLQPYSLVILSLLGGGIVHLSGPVLRLAPHMMEYFKQKKYRNSRRLLLAAREGNINAVKEMLDSKSGYDINRRDIMGNTALHYAALKGNLELVQYLLACGANPNIKNNNKLIPLHNASFAGYSRVITLLTSYPLQDLSFLKKSSIKMGIFSYKKIVLRMVKARTEQKWTSLMMTVANNHLDASKILIELVGNDENAINTQNNEGDTALHIAIRYQYIEQVKLLLSCKLIRLDLPNNEGYEPLHLAAYYGFKEIGELLIATNKININKPGGRYGRTPLHEAVINAHSTFVDILLQYNKTPVDLLIRTKNGKNCLDHIKALSIIEPEQSLPFVMHMKKIETKINDYIKHMNISISNQYAYAKNAISIFDRDKIDELTKENKTYYLRYAVLLDDAKLIESLISKGADPNGKDEYGWSHLHDAAFYGSTNAVTQLIKERANINDRNKAGWTPIMFAVWSHKNDIVNKLIIAGADFGLQNKYG